MASLNDIAKQLAGYDPQALSVPMAQQFIAELVHRMPPWPSHSIPVDQAFERILASDVTSPIDVPGHNNSAMDGFAFCAADQTSDDAQHMRCVGHVLAGQAWHGRVERGQCIRITTGAVMPSGLDTVIPVELTQVEGTRVQWSRQMVQAGDNRRLAGEDIAKGAVALRRGERLGPAQMGLLASLGITEVAVQRQPRVAYFSTGDEILSLGQAPRAGAIYDSNRYTVRGMLQRLGCEVVDLGVIPDEPVALEACFLNAAREADVIITSGGVSMGEADHTKAMMRRLGDVAFWRIAMRPGRPMALGTLGQSLLFGLPGNPVAVMVTFIAFVRPALLQRMGVTSVQPLMIRAKSQEALRKKPGRTEYQRGCLSRDAQQQLWVKTTGQQGSGVLSSMVQADGLIVLHHDQGDVEPGEEVDVLLLETCV